MTKAGFTVMKPGVQAEGCRLLAGRETTVKDRGSKFNGSQFKVREP
jgi:hypothetical protein